MNSGFKDLLRISGEESVEFVVVGAYAVLHHTQPRYAKDLDAWTRPSAENARRVSRAFRRFGVPVVDLTEAGFSDGGLQHAIGLPPSQTGFLTSLPGVGSGSAWKNHAVGQAAGVSIPFLGTTRLVAAKTRAGRPQDLADLEELRRAGNHRDP